MFHSAFYITQYALRNAAFYQQSRRIDVDIEEISFLHLLTFWVRHIVSLLGDAEFLKENASSTSNLLLKSHQIENMDRPCNSPKIVKISKDRSSEAFIYPYLVHQM